MNAKNRPLCAIVVFILLAIGFGCQKKEKQEQKASAVKLEKGQSIENEQEHADALHAIVLRSHYDKKRKLLSVTVQLENTSNKSIFLIAENSNFVNMELSIGHYLGVVQRDDSLLFDLSFLNPTEDGIAYFLGEGVLGNVPRVIEMQPHVPQNKTYVFQFPLKLDHNYSDTVTVEEPELPKKVTLRFGYSLVPWEDFYLNKPYPPDQTIETRTKTILEKWQTTITTKSVLVDFDN